MFVIINFIRVSHNVNYVNFENNLIDKRHALPIMSLYIDNLPIDLVLN